MRATHRLPPNTNSRNSFRWFQRLVLQAVPGFPLRFDHVNVRHKDGTLALDNLSLRIEAGDFTFLVGRTGAGKSTLLNLICREQRPSSGTMQWGELQLHRIRDWHLPRLRRRMGIVPQDFILLPRRTVRQNLLYAMRAVGFRKASAQARIPHLLRAVGMFDRAEALPAQLSGGEQQRVAIARAMIHEPELLLCDEPTGNLDPETSAEIIELLRQLNKLGTTIIVATHDHAMIDRFGGRVVTLEKGRLASDATLEPQVVKEASFV